LGRKAMEMAGVDRLDALYTAIDAVRRGGTISISGVYGGMKDPLPMMTMFDRIRHRVVRQRGGRVCGESTGYSLHNLSSAARRLGEMTR
ncbi:hypothetical protein NJ76_23590, partial [Rhodococcus sp. IITR03]